METGIPALTMHSRWVIYVAVVGSIAVITLVLRIWSIERSHRRIRAMLEKRVVQRTRDLERAFVLTEHVVSAVSEALVVVDTSGEAVLVNPAARSLLDVGDGSDDSKQICRIFHRRHPDLHEAMRAHFQDDHSTEPFTVPVEIHGRNRVLEVSAAPLDGDEYGYVYVIRDVTEALTILEMKSRFVSIVSHEIRTPLTSLAGSLDLLDAGALGPLPTRAAELISVARISADRLVRLVNDVLDLDRLESQRVNLVPRWQTTDDLLVETLRTMQPLAAKHRVTLIAESNDEPVFADHDRIVQVLLNLVQNAIKFSPADSAVVMSAHGQANGPANEMVFTVEDEGRGIPPCDLEKVFEPFTQIDTADDRRDSGTGLGLTISRGIVQRHGGRICAENRQPAGTRFVFALPLPAQEMAS